MFPMQPIGFVKSPYKDTKQIPKGPGAKHDAVGILEIKSEFEIGLTDIEGFSHVFVIWIFDRANGFNLIGTPPTDNREHGVFATRSPRQPNPIGLTVVEVLRRQGPLLHVRGVDMLDGTPILDIKPYLSSVPPDQLRRGWMMEVEERTSSQPMDFQAQLKAAQNSVKALTHKRERLIGDLRVEEARVAQTVATLKELGIANADKMSVAELKAAADKTQAELVTNLDALKAQILEAEAVMAEYEAVIQEEGNLKQPSSDE